MKVLPEGAKVLVVPDKVEEKTKGGIILPEKVKKDERLRMWKGTIVAMGPKAYVVFANDETGETDVAAKIGDRVIYAMYGGMVIRDEDDPSIELYRVLNDEDVVCKIIED